MNKCVLLKPTGPLSVEFTLQYAQTQAVIFTWTSDSHRCACEYERSVGLVVNWWPAQCVQGLTHNVWDRLQPPLWRCQGEAFIDNSCTDGWIFELTKCLFCTKNNGISCQLASVPGVEGRRLWGPWADSRNDQNSEKLFFTYCLSQFLICVFVYPPTMTVFSFSVVKRQMDVFSLIVHPSCPLFQFLVFTELKLVFTLLRQPVLLVE